MRQELRKLIALNFKRISIEHVTPRNQEASLTPRSFIPQSWGQCLQPLYNLYDREEFENELKPVCEKNKIGVIPYYSLAAGFLTGKYRSTQDFNKSVRGARTVERYLNERGNKILKALNQVAASKNSKQATVALAWLMAQPSVVAPIASATSIEQLKDLLAAMHLKLKPEELQILSRTISS